MIDLFFHADLNGITFQLDIPFKDRTAKKLPRFVFMSLDAPPLKPQVIGKDRLFAVTSILTGQSMQAVGQEGIGVYRYVGDGRRLIWKVKEPC
jgi:hypothetical protein